MSLFKITVKSSGAANGVRYEKGMSVEVVSQYHNPLNVNGGQEVRDAFMRAYGIDLKKACRLSASYLDVVKIN